MIIVQKTNEKIKQHSSLLVAATSIIAVIITIICLSRGITIVFPHFYYVPIILTAYYYPKKGILFSVFISAAYLSLIALIGNPTPEIWASAIVRVVVFITAAAVVSYLVNKQRKTENAAKQKLNLEIATLKISSIFSREYDLKESIEKALMIVGTMSNTDRVYLFLLRDEGRIMYNAYEWCADGVNPQIDNLQDLPSDMFPWWMEKLEQGETINISDVSRIPPEAEAEKKILESQDIKSILILPLRSNRRLEGFIGFDNVREAKEWKAEDISLLTTTAATIGKVIEIRKYRGKLQESEWFLQGVFNSIQDGITVLDNELNIIRVNRWMEIAYASQAPLQGRKCYVVYQHRESPCPWCPSLRAIETGKVHSEIIVPYSSEENPSGWIYLTAFPLKDSAGHVTGVIEHVKDITDLKNAEEALRESEEKFRTLATSTPVGIVLYQDNRIIYSNPAAEEGCGYSKDELRQMNFWDFVHPDYIKLVKERGRAQQKDEKQKVEKTVNRYE
ncbi:MAG: PAS domain S-box protein, partial [Methanogenium sp.]|nr:PAS domain S-box protein [Methanogenium sp.]